LANVLGHIVNTLTNQTPSSNSNQRGTNAHIPNTSSNTKPDKLNNFLFQYHLYFHTNLMQFNINIGKINFTITRAAQDWFEINLNQKD